MNKIVLDNGKYTVINELGEGGGFRALRHGEEWRSLAGDGLVLAMYHEIERLNEQLDRDFGEAATNHIVMEMQQSEIERLRTVIEDFAKHGTRHDTTPTIGGRIKRRDDVLGFYGYMRSMDDSVRRRAMEAIGE
ncbi:hypothetical protein [Sporosarcina koreensis]|uniref:hypothetical protein n=1 Tax=Sporosarcina koreensis TaxID=334735 RepID=UPI0007577480|nr:hypothetical protein [Sporosarcina koreensis]